MDLRRLAYFVAVAEEASFTRAAAREHIAQPAISRQVMQLERELGEPLFVRESSGARLTQAGAALLPHARAALDAAASGRDAVRALRGLLSGQLAVGTVLPGPRRLPQLVGAFRRTHPGVTVRLREGHSSALVQAVVAGALDAAVIGIGGRQRAPAGVDTQLIDVEPVVVVAAPTHPLATRRTVTIAQLAGEPMVALPFGSGQREMLQASAAAAGFTPEVTAESSDLATLVELARQGVGVTLVPRKAIARQPDIAIIPLARPKLQRRLLLVWREDGLSPAGRAWLQLARRELSVTPD